MASESPIAGTKFFIPTSLHPLVHRPRLHTLLNEGIHHPLTLLSAPAGYGKTSLLADWLLTKKTNMCVAWVSLDAQDDDAYRFWLCICLALEHCAPELIKPLLSMLQSQSHPDVKAMLSLLINQLLVTNDACYVLVIDDYHLITEPAIHEGLSYLIEQLPPQLRLILATRTDPPLPLHRLRAREQVLEVRMEFLQCSIPEATTFLKEVMGLSLAPKDIAMITERTEGWLVGLQLIALSIREQALLPQLLTMVSGSQRYISEYLIEEVLQHQPEHIQKFLGVTSLLDQFCGSLGDALLGERNSQQIIEELEHMHLFVVALDGEGIWYRYHHLFAEALHHRFSQSMPQEEINSLYLKASTWYSDQGQMHEAIHYALRGRNWERVITLLEQFLRNLYWQTGEVYIMQRWIQQLPSESFQTHPRLGLFMAWVYYGLGDLHTSEMWLEAAEAALPCVLSAKKRNHLHAEILARRALGMGFYGHADTAFLLCEQALPLLDNTQAYTRGIVYSAQTWVFLARGEAKAALQALQSAVVCYRQSGVTAAEYWWSCMSTVYLRMLGRLKQAEHTLEQLQKEQPSQSRGVAYAYQAAVLYEHNQLEQALDLALQARQLFEQTGANFFGNQAYLILVQIYLARREFEVAEATVQQLCNFPAYQNNMYAQSWLLSGLQVRLWLLTGKLEIARHWRQGQQQRDPLPSIFAQERETIVLVRILLAERKAEEAIRLIATWLPSARSAERWEHVLEMRLLEALALQQLRREAMAQDALEEALALGEPEGYLRHFLDEGPEILPLLKRNRATHREPRPYVDQLIDAFITAGQQEIMPRLSPHSQILIDPVSAREQEVLELLAQGASNQDIAHTLTIAPNTVKRHVQAILAKLNASNRTQAVARARTLDLLPEKH